MGAGQAHEEIERAMARLRAAERERRVAIDELIRLGVVRSRVLVGDLGEQLPAAFYGVELAPSFTPGHDLVDQRGRRIDVKTLRATPTRPRTIIGEVKQPCDVVFAIRLDVDYSPTEALEIPADVARDYTGKNGKVSWTRSLVEHKRVRHIPARELLRPAAPRLDDGEVAPESLTPNDLDATIRLIGPEIEVLGATGGRRLVFPMDDGYSEWWDRLPKDEQNWEPSWGFHPDDDPDRYPPGAVF